MYLLKVESGIVFPDHDQFTENSLYTKKSKRFAKDHAYGEEAEIYVLKYLREHYKRFNWYSCQEYCKIIKQDYSNKLDTLYGDIIGCFKSGWAAIKINVKRSEKEGEIATATHYGSETELFNSDPRGFTFYLSVGPNIENTDEWDMIWANCLVKERPVRIDNKYVWMRDQLIKYAVPFNKVLKIVCKRKDKNGGPIVHDNKLWDELESLYKVLNADKLCYNSIIGKPKESSSEEIVIPTFIESEDLDKNRPDQHHIHSKYEGRFATLGEHRIQDAESLAKNGKDTIFYLYKKEKGRVSNDKPLEIWYSDIKNDLDNLYIGKNGSRYILANKLEKYAR
jgi:hypothetical protein